MHGETDRQKDRRTDGQTDRQADRHADICAALNVLSARSFVGRMMLVRRADRPIDRRTDHPLLTSFSMLC